MLSPAPMLDYLPDRPFLSAATVAGLLGLVLVAYLARLNQLLRGTPDEIRRLNPAGWTKDLLLATYQRLESSPITTSTYAQRIPPKLERRYIVTGGSGESSPFPLARGSLRWCDLASCIDETVP